MKKAIAFMDSGLGGISVMAEARKLLPYENFIMYGDSKNAPYGEKTDGEVTRLTINAAKKLLEYNIKALVIACNTATSIAGKKLYTKMPIPIVGIVPPLKQAQGLKKEGEILVMLTPAAAKSHTIQNMLRHYGENTNILPCPGLMEFVERGELKGENLHKKLETLLNPYINKKIDVVALGCTHYPFLTEEIRNFFDKDTAFINGGDESARTLKALLEKQGLLTQDKTPGKTLFLNSSEDKIPLMKELYLSLGFDKEEII
ncbi:MAG: glutamate racemase [Eubacteriales bacterium]|nr:glutamate racemase [Eubacteriales bacterium]